MAEKQSLSHQMAAELLGVSVRRVAQIVRDGQGPVQTADGRFPPAEFGVWLRERFKAEMGIAEDGKAYDFQAERGRLTKAQADKTELEVAELAGELVDAEEVAQYWEQLVGAARTKFLSFPSKVAQRIAGPDKIVETQELAQACVYEALNELAVDGLPPRARARVQARKDRLETAAKTEAEPVGGRGKKTKPGE